MNEYIAVKNVSNDFRLVGMGEKGLKFICDNKIFNENYLYF